MNIISLIETLLFIIIIAAVVIAAVVLIGATVIAIKDATKEKSNTIDALEFLKKRKKMCNGYAGCFGCPLYESFEFAPCDDALMTDEQMNEYVKIVQEWKEEDGKES